MIVSLPDCAICLGQVKDGVLCPFCQQGYCKTCLNVSLATKKECPVCRNRIASIQNASPIDRILQRLNVRERPRREEIPPPSVFYSPPSVMNEKTLNKRIALVYTPGRRTFSNPFAAFGLNFHLEFQEREEFVGLFLSREPLTNFFNKLMISYTFAPLGSANIKTFTSDFGGENESWGSSKYFSKSELQRIVADNGTLSINVVMEIDESDRKKMDYFGKNRKEIEEMDSRTFDSLIASFWNNTDLALIRAPDNCVISKRIALIYTPNEDTSSNNFFAFGLQFHLEFSENGEDKNYMGLYLHRENLVNFFKNMMVTISFKLVGENQTGVFTNNFGGGSPGGYGLTKYILKSELEKIVCDNGMVGVIVTLKIDGGLGKKIEYFVKNRQTIERMNTGKYNSLIAPFLNG